MILGKSEDLAVVTFVDRSDVRIINAHVYAVFFNVACEIQQDVILHIDLSIIGVHPEYICKLSAVSACFKQCPVVVPVNNFNFDLGIAQSCPVIADRLNTLLLICIPDIDGQVAAGRRRAGTSTLGGTAGAAAGCQRQNHCRSQYG